ncbi:hypothetical protein EJD97_014197, partial [Solanum chilense]
IMPPCRDKNSNANARNANIAPSIPDQEVSNVEFINSIKMLAQSLTNENNQVHASVNAFGGSATSMVRDFVRMNPPEFLGSQINEDPQNFLNENMKIFKVMQVKGYKLREKANENKKARNGNYDNSQQKSGVENRSHIQQNFSAPTPMSACVPSSKKRYDKKGLSLREVFQATRLTPLVLSVIRISWDSVSQEKKDALGEASLVTAQYSSSEAPKRPLTQQDRSSGPVLVKDSISETTTLESVVVINEFPKVCPEDLPLIPREREINFGIDLYPDTQPFSIPPYRMPPA